MSIGRQVFRGCLWAALLVGAVAALTLVPECGSRRHARRVSCLANMKSLALATLTYVAEWDDRFPPPPRSAAAPSVGAGRIETGAPDLAEWFAPDDWHRRINYRNSQVFVCPSTRSIYSYEMDERLYGVSLHEWGRGEGLLSGALMQYENGYRSGAAPGPHDGGYNTSYCDGHVKWMPPLRRADQERGP